MNQPIQPLRAAIARAFALSLSMGALAACGGGGGGGSAAPGVDLPPEQETFSARVFGLGIAPVDGGTGQYDLYVHATKEDGSPVTTQEWADNVVVTTNSGTVNPDLYEVADIGADAGSIISLNFLTDYSNSMPDATLESTGTVYQALLDGLPSGWEAQSRTFAARGDGTVEIHTRQTFTRDQTALQNSFSYDPNRRGEYTPLYDAVGWGIHGTGFEGLNDRCAPIRFEVLYTDGMETSGDGSPGSLRWVGEGGKQELIADMHRFHVTPIFLGIQDADVDTLSQLANGRGLIVYAHDNSGITSQLQRYANSLGSIMRIRVDNGVLTGADGEQVTVEINGDSSSIDVYESLDWARREAAGDCRSAS